MRKFPNKNGMSPPGGDQKVHTNPLPAPEKRLPAPLASPVSPESSSLLGKMPLAHRRETRQPRYDEAVCTKCGRVKCYQLLVLAENQWQCANCKDTRRRVREKRGEQSASQRARE